MKKFRFISLTANSAILAAEDNLKHECRLSTKVADRRVGQTDTSLVRFDLSEVIPRAIVDGTGSKTVLENVRVGFTRYDDGTNTTADFIAAWERVKGNVDIAIANGSLNGFIVSPSVELVAAV